MALKSDIADFLVDLQFFPFTWTSSGDDNSMRVVMIDSTTEQERAEAIKKLLDTSFSLLNRIERGDSWE